MKLAIVGAGISGLVCAHRLHPEHDITVYEAGAEVGGHTNTVRVEIGGEAHWVDTGFIVYNDRNYPNFEPLLAELGVATQSSRMSFSVSDDAGSFEYAGTPRGLFAKPAHAADPRFLRMVGRPLRFNREARSLLDLARGRGPVAARVPGRGRLRRVVHRAADRAPGLRGVVGRPGARCGRSRPRSSPASSTTTACSGFTGRPRWRTVTGGSRRYVEEIIAPVRATASAGPPRCGRSSGRPHGVVVARRGLREPSDSTRWWWPRTPTRRWRMLHRPTDAEREVLGAIAYQPNEAVLHTDASLLPRRRAALGELELPPGRLRRRPRGRG